MSTTVKLKTPITFGSATIGELTFRRPKAKDFAGIELKIGDGGLVLDFSSILRLAGRLCGQPDAVIGEVDIGDFTEITEIVMGFIMPGRPIGETGSPS